MSEDRIESNDGRPADEGVVPKPQRPQGASEGEQPALQVPPLDASSDDEFFLVIDDLDDAAPAPAVSAADSLGLEGLFDRPARGSAEDDDELEVLFDTRSTPVAEHGFSGAQPAPDFVEDHAGWLGDDVDLGKLVGESTTDDAAAARAAEHLVERDERDDGGDPFLLEDIEVESLDPVAQAVPEAEDDEFLVGDVESGDAASEAQSGEAAAFEPNETTAESAAEPAPTLHAWEDRAVPSDDWAPLAASSSPLLTPVDAGDEANAADAPAWANSDFTLQEDATEPEAVTPQAGFGTPLRSADQDWHQGVPSEVEGAVDDAAATEAVEEQDPIYGEHAAASPEASFEPPAVEAEGFEEDPELAATVVESAPPPLRVVSQASRSRTWVRRAAAAAVLVVGVGAAVLAIEPKWLGLGADEPVIERVEVARPRIDVSLPPPVTTHEGDPVTPPPVENQTPTPQDPPVELPPVEPDPVETTPSQPEPTPPPVDPRIELPLPVEPPVVVTPEPTPTTPSKPPVETNFSPMMVGEYLEVISPVKDDAVAVPGVLPIGTRALAMMRNDEIFVGVVRRMDAKVVTLDLEPGEVSLALASLTRIQPLAEAGLDESMEAERGFVRLKNATRFFGRILRDAESGRVIVQVDGTRISLPKDQVDSFGAAGSSPTNVVFEGDSDWLDQRVRQQLLQLGRGGVPLEPTGQEQAPRGTRSTETVAPTPPSPVKR